MIVHDAEIEHNENKSQAARTRCSVDRTPQRPYDAALGVGVMSWKRSFYDPIVLPDRRHLVTLEDAGNYITRLPKAERDLRKVLLSVPPMQPPL